MIREVVQGLIGDQENFNSRQRHQDPGKDSVAVQINVKNVQTPIRRVPRIEDQTEKPAV